jgi:Spy/CpxP family protein refolding chaperone
MKRITIVSIVVALLLLTGVLIVRAGTRRQHGYWHRPGPASYLAHELKLSDAQRTQVRTLWEVERPIAAGHIYELLAENKELNAIAANEHPDHDAIRTVADREAATITSLLMEKAQLQSKIYSNVLNSDQRGKAIELENKMESRMEHAAHRIEAEPTAR